MNLLRNVLAVSFLAISPVISHAAPLTSTVSLPGGVAFANRDFEIQLGDLLEVVDYRVYCTLISNDKSKQSEDYIQLFNGDQRIKIFVNGNQVTNNGQATISAQTANSLSFEHVRSSDGSITLRNLDDTDSIVVTNCYGVPQV